MIGIIIALVIALGVGGTVVADTAGPGDLLFPVDQAVETIQLSLAGDDKKNELRIKFSEERISEIEDLVGESADESIDADKQSFPVEEQENITVGIEAVLNLLAQLKEQEQGDSRIDSIASKLNEYMDNLPSNARIEVGEDKLHIKFEDNESGDNTDGGNDSEVEIKNENKNGAVKAEIRTDEGRIKIEVKNGILEIKTKLEDDSNDDKEDTTDSNSKDSGDGLEEIEAKVLSDKTVVEIKIDNEKTTFTTSATSREDIIAAIIAKFPSLTSAEITAVLKIETEDDDQDDSQDDDSDEDSNSDDSKEEDDQNDSNSGSDDNR